MLDISLATMWPRGLINSVKIVNLLLQFNNSFKHKKEGKQKTEMESDGSHKQLHKAISVNMQCEMQNKPMFSCKGASFIKVLGRDFSKQLQLPEEFTANITGYVPHRFIIESGTTNKCWRVEVEKDGDGRMYFRDGWADFVEFHSLEVGNILLFEYEEQSIFQARIYGRNGCEKTLLLDSKGGQCKPLKTINDDDGEESEALDEPVIVKCSRQKTRSLSSRKYGNGIYKKRTVNRDYRRTAKVSVTQNNLCFSVIMHYRKRHQFNQLTVPKAVSLKMKLPSKDELKIQDAQGKCWTLALGHRRDGRALFSQGWKEFLKDNNVAPGDKLKFEFMSDEIVQCHVTRASEVNEHQSNEPTRSSDMDCNLDKPNTRIVSRAPKNRAGGISMTSKRRMSCESGSSFSVMWRDSCARTYLHMPKAIVRDQNLMNKENIVLRDPEGKCWPHEVKKLTGNRVALAKGWVEFWKGHGLKTGDFLNFEFVSENLVQVNINRGKPQHEPNVEDTVIYLDAIDDEEAAAIEPEAVITQQAGLQAGIEPEVGITHEGFDAAFSAEAGITQEGYDAAMETEAFITLEAFDEATTQV
ncbi:hypothetical protein BVRB_001020 [Beta vulgaris subsp. vulgaris]|uniref:TF-B3 domain-containing protein n=2 Tax=Beta vulgaris subsp. vulgaris TaxID=3555 RepID=A0A0J8B8P3_BETVV|nr:hypothetical protein BVRB_001020 [Beta vulgaris subsp. vulgaris]